MAGITFNEEDYCLIFKDLLHEEDKELEERMRLLYNSKNVQINKIDGVLCSLYVPELSENWPPLVRGDCAYVTPAIASHKSYLGFIDRVEVEKVLMKLDVRFHIDSYSDNTLFDVQFIHNRTNLRQLYQAVETASLLDRELLFPSAFFQLRPQERILPTRIYSDLNEKQGMAVDMIFVHEGGSPYVIHGPPGTGKTKTLIEAILQIYRGNRRARILACAPSNSAADHILERLVSEKSVQIQKNEIIRLNPCTRTFDDVNPKHIEFCYLDNLVFESPPKKDLQRYRIIVSTYVRASSLYEEGIQKGHFSHIFLDDAGQASEPETMLPIAHLYTTETVLVLAGDPMQLGPVVFSNVCKSRGLEVSYLERLMQLYRKRDHCCMTRLTQNYRTHKAILEVPSELFYKGALIPCKNENNNNSLSWEGIIPNKEFPLLFIGIDGCGEREGRNPSWFNNSEIMKIVSIVDDLIFNKGQKEEEIGVIAPYRKQVSEIRGGLESLGYLNVKVGSVEQFQGQEREVIIISTVRSSVEDGDFDEAHRLGFLDNSRRFNVAVNRAKSLLIVVGNPQIICKDPNWGKLMWYCVVNKSYEGCSLLECAEGLGAGSKLQVLLSKYAA